MFRIKSYYCKKGYDKLLKNKNLKFVRDIKNSLMLTTVLADTSKYFYNRELSLRQYLLSYFGLQRLERSILFFLGSGLSIKFLPLTGSQLKVLRSHGIKASWFWTKFSLISFLIYIHFKAIYFLFKLVISNQIDYFYQGNSRKKVYFINISKINFPDPYKDNKSYDIISWYTSFFKAKNIEFYHNESLKMKAKKIGENEIKYIPYFFPKPENNFLFFKEAVCLFIKSFQNLFSKNYPNSCLIYEDLISLFFKNASRNQIFNEYLFCYSSNVYRPIWTYFAESKGSKIILYHQSSCHSLPSIHKNDKIPANYFPIMSWSKMLIWDEYFLNEIRDFTPYIKEIEVVGPIDYGFKKIEIPEILDSKNIISIFDTPPVKIKEWFGFTTANEYGFIKPEPHIKFINDIIEASESFSNLKLIIKPKREISKKIQELKYENLIKSVSMLDNIIILNPNLPAKRIIERSKLVISFPGTSTSTIAKSIGVKTIFYDSTGISFPKRNSLYGVSLIKDINNLRRIINASLKN